MKPRPKPKQVQVTVDLTPYRCFSRTCDNLVQPTKDSRPWFCPVCTGHIKDAIRKERLKEVKYGQR